MKILAMPAFSNRKHNPYNSLLYEPMAGMGAEVREFSRGRLLRERADVWHMHWPEGTLIESGLAWTVVRMTIFFALLVLAKLKGTKLVWTMHNFHTHEQPHPRLEQWFWRLFPPRLDGCISLSEAGRRMAMERLSVLRDKPIFVVPHGHYRGVYKNTVSREEARGRLGVAPDAPMMAYLGLIRPYKNVPLLVRAFRQLENSKAALCVAGKPHTPELAREIEMAADGDPRIRMNLGFIPDDDVQVYLRAADLVVLPFSEILNSGSALLALSFDCPILIPRKGAMQELEARVGKDWVRTYEGDLTVQTLDEALRWARETARPARAPLEPFDWPRLAAETLEAYRQVCAGSRQRRQP
jgi:glycosyltransferase involved in cell wall biosynthesis